MSQSDFVQPLPGDVLLVYSHDWLDEAINLVEELGMLRQHVKPPPHRPIYSHTAICIGNGYIIEALGNGLVKSNIHKYFGQADVWTVDLDVVQRERIANRACSMLIQDYKYSYWDIFVQFCWLVFGLKIPWRQKHSLICSVFCYDCYASAGIKIAKRKNCAPVDIEVGGVLHFKGKL